MQRIFASLVLMLFTFITVSAQSTFTLPDDLAIITPENVTQLTPLAQLGGATPGITRWSPDGQTLLAQSSDGVYQYNVGALDTPEFFETLQYIEYSATGHYAIERGRLLDGSTLAVIDDTAYYGFTADGSVLVSSDEGEIHLADAETLEEFGTLPTSGSVVLSEDRRRAAVWYGGEYVPDGDFSSWIPYTVELWDVENERLLMTETYGLDYFFPPQFSGRWLIAGDNGDLVVGTIDIWDTETGELAQSHPSAGAYSTPIVSSDGRILLLEGYAVQLIWLDDSRLRLDLSDEYDDYEGISRDAAFSADSSLFAFENPTGIAVYDVSGTSIPMEGPIALLPNQQLVMFGNQEHILLTSGDGLLSLWNIDESGAALRLTITPDENRRIQSAFSPDDQFYLGNDGALIETTTGETRYTFPLASNPQFNVDWSYAAYWNNATLILVDIATGAEQVLYEIEGNLGSIVTLNPNSEIVVFRGDDSMLRGYDLRTGELRFELEDADFVHFNDRGTRLLTGTANGTTIWDITGDAPAAMFETQASSYYSVISADGRLFAFISSPLPTSHDFDMMSFTIEVWDVEANRQVGQYTFESREIPELNFSPDNQLLGVVLNDSALFCPIALDNPECHGLYYSFESMMHPYGMLFNASGELVVLELYLSGPDGGHGVYLYIESVERIVSGEAEWNNDALLVDSASPVFSPDGALLLTQDSYPSYYTPPTYLHLRDSTGQELFVFDGLPMAVFSPDNRLIATHNNGVEFWDVDALRSGTATPLSTIPVTGDRRLMFNGDGTLLFVYEARRITMWGVHQN